MSNVAIKIRNIYSYIVTTDKKLIRRIRNEFTFEDRGTQFSRYAIALRKARWAWGASLGTSFVSEGGRFATGLLPEIITEVISITLCNLQLRANNIPFERIDERGREYAQAPLIEVNEDTLADSPANIKLRDYQVEAANLALRERRGIVQCATGTG